MVDVTAGAPGRWVRCVPPLSPPPWETFIPSNVTRGHSHFTVGGGPPLHFKKGGPPFTFQEGGVPSHFKGGPHSHFKGGALHTSHLYNGAPVPAAGAGVNVLQSTEMRTSGWSAPIHHLTI